MSSETSNEMPNENETSVTPENTAQPEDQSVHVNSAAHVGVVDLGIPDVMQENYLDYALSVIMDRALPDVRDGLKPVHRRILYAMNELNMGPGTPHKKSARVVGDVIGKYHPHGDTSVYDAAVHMAQPWAKNITLVDGHGNFGSVDGDRPAAMRYCFVAGTRASTEHGLLPIEKLVKPVILEKALSQPTKKFDAELDMMGESAKGPGHFSRWVYSGVQDTVTVTTKHGFSATCTPNEPFLTLNKDLEYTWVDASDLKAGDHVCMMGKPSSVGHPPGQDLTGLHPDKSDIAANGKVFPLPAKMSCDLASIMGSIVADGCLRPDTNEIIFSSSDTDSFRSFTKSFSQVFPGVAFKIRKLQASKTGYASTKPCQQFSVSSAWLFKFFLNLGYGGFDSYAVSVPEIIFCSAKDEVAAFLRAYYDGNGSVYGPETQRTVAACSVNPKLLNDVKLLLLVNFGIVTGKVLSYRKHHRRLLITQGSQVDAFEKAIGFLSRRKNDILSQRSVSKSGAPSGFDILPHVAKYCMAFAKSRMLTARHYSSDDNKKMLDRDFGSISSLTSLPVSRSACTERVNEIVATNSGFCRHWPSLTNKLTDILARGYFYAEIESVTDAGKQPVYDVTIDETHAFTANGFIVHNTEMRMSRGGAAFFEDINQDTVNFKPNYDGSEKEPEVLPVAYPNLWVNGSEGIAVGMATRIAPHNMAETIEAAFLCMEKGDQLTDEEILAVMPGPDFPTGGIVHDLQGFRDALATGRGAVKIRSKWHPEKNKRGTTEYIVLDELPYQVDKANLVMAISLKAKEGILEDITDIRDESNKSGIRVVVELRKGASPEVVFHRLVRHSDVEVSYSYNVMVLDGIKPYQMGLRQILTRFLDFRSEVIRRRTAFQMKKAEARLHILAGLMKALDKMDDTIRTVRAHQRPAEASTALQALLQIDETQAQAILDLKLQKLTGMELTSLRDEHREVTLKVEDCKDILDTPERVNTIMREEMIRVRDRFGVPRRTEISYETSNVSMADLVKKEPCLIHRTHSGYIKRMPLSDLGVQNRYTQGKSGIQLTDNDYVEAVYTGCTHDMFMIFTKSGKTFARRVWQLPEGTGTSRGRHLRNLFEDLDEPIAQMLFVPEMEIPDLTVVTATARGKIKRTPLEEYRSALRKNGVQGIGLDEGDEIVGAGVCRNHDHLLLVTADGRALRFEVTEDATRLLSRGAAGVRGIKTDAESPLISMMVILGNGQPLGFRKVMRNRIIDEQEVEVEVEEPDTLTMDEGWYLLCVGMNGVGKRTPVSEFSPQGRAGKGVNCFNINKKTGPMVRAALVHEEEDLVLVTAARSLRIHIRDVRIASRITAGTYLMDVTGESLVDVQAVPGDMTGDPAEAVAETAT